MVGLLMDVWRNSIRKKWDLPHFKQPKSEKTQNPVVLGMFYLSKSIGSHLENFYTSGPILCF